MHAFIVARRRTARLLVTGCAQIAAFLVANDVPRQLNCRATSAFASGA